MTGRVCVKKREKWRVLCNVNAERGGRGPLTAASQPGSAQGQIARCFPLTQLRFWAEPGHLPGILPLGQILVPRLAFLTHPQIPVLEPGTRPRESLTLSGPSRMLRCRPGTRPTPGSRLLIPTRPICSTNRWPGLHFKGTEDR